MVEDQKIAAFGSSYRGMHSNVGAAAGCDLLTLQQKQQSRPKAALSGAG
ncbi:MULTISPECIES: hypothetical protein [unclassified Pseudomonas]|nr:MULTISPECIES: hypothetical protein [unclassified Pseudomonas]